MQRFTVKDIRGKTAAPVFTMEAYGVEDAFGRLERLVGRTVNRECFAVIENNSKSLPYTVVAVDARGENHVLHTWGQDEAEASKRAGMIDPDELGTEYLHEIGYTVVAVFFGHLPEAMADY